MRPLNQSTAQSRKKFTTDLTTQTVYHIVNPSSELLD